ncbi:MAG: gas vesicle protein GvpG [Phycisphaerales bacterium]
MFVIDRLALLPVTGFVWLMKELHGAVLAEQENERDRLTDRLRSLHMQFETGRITEREFDEAEAQILDRLDELDGANDTAGEHHDEEQQT